MTVPMNAPGTLPHAWSRFLARVMLVWPGRAGTTNAEGLRAIHRNHPYRLEGAWFDALRHLEPHESRGLSQTDSDAALDMFLRCHPDYREWARAAIAPPDISINWQAGQPIIAPASIAHWEQLCDTLDSDAMLCLDLVDRYGSRAIERIPALTEWMTVPRASDHELRVLYAKGLSDLHIHAGGTRIPQAAWLDAMATVDDADGLRELSRIYEVEAPARSFRDHLADARAARAKLAKEVGASAALDRGGQRWWDWSPARLAPERVLLARAWAAVLDGKDDAARRLDAYLTHKNRFMTLARQPIFAETPGLRLFDTRYVGALWRPPAKRPRRGQITFRSSMRFHNRREANGAAYILESPQLRRAELRIAPFRRPIEYLIFFKHWDMVARELQRSFSTQQRPSVDIRFAVHFLRTAGPGAGKTRRMTSMLDRSTAVLRLAYAQSTPAQLRLLAPLSRIDMAGQERDAQVMAFALHMRLLRDEPDAMHSLDDAAAGHPCAAILKHWLDLRYRGLHRPPIDAPRLGLTVHAGEDFADVMDGLHQIASAMDVLSMTAGDTIGHGLALTAPVQHTIAARRPMLPRGTQHDSLCWLAHCLQTHDNEGLFVGIRNALASAVASTGQDIHAAAGATADDFVWAYLHRQRPRKKPYDEASPLRQSIVRSIYQDEAVLDRRDHLVPLDRIRDGLGSVIAWAQRKLIQVATERRIVVELNPASNVRISGVDATAGSPTVALAQATEEGLLACVNTDNPGVFSSCIENEYALLLHGLLEAGTTQGTARRILETLRRTGMEVLN